MYLFIPTKEANRIEAYFSDDVMTSKHSIDFDSVAFCHQTVVLLPEMNWSVSRRSTRRAPQRFPSQLPSVAPESDDSPPLH